MDTLEALKSGQLAGRSRLDLSCGLTEFPTEIFDLADSLTLLNLPNNNLSSLPDDFSKLENLEVVFFNNNQFEDFPTVLATCPKLRMVTFKNNRLARIDGKALPPNLQWLTLTNNQIEVLPSEIGKLRKLQKFLLAGNQLRSLPKELQCCQNLELIRLASNHLEELPNWLLDLPRLSWLAYAGNPFCAVDTVAAPTARSLPTISWTDLEVGPVLGQGASGVIYKGSWQFNEDEPKDVAIKVFKGDITSDGSPLDEMRACITAENHPNLVTVLGKASGHPEGKSALIFEFLTSDRAPLGGPPSLESCTRDTYPEDKAFRLSQIVSIATGIAAVASHLHTRGILHGDLYAHNILVDGGGESILSDFGAASFYDPSDTELAPILEAIEVRSFGCLLEELLERCDENGEVIWQKLRNLQQECMGGDRSQRPRFAAIHDALKNL